MTAHLPQIAETPFSDENFKIRIGAMKRAELAERRKQVLRGQLAFLIADTPAHEDRPLSELLLISDNILKQFNVTRRRVEK